MNDKSDRKNDSKAKGGAAKGEVPKDEAAKVEAAKGGAAGEVIPLIRKKRRCPTCGRPAAADYRPFCSKRCADVDLGRWLKGGYRIPGEPVPREDPEPEEDY